MENSMEKIDILIIGGGPGGLTAGLYCSRARLKTVILEGAIPGGQIANTEKIEDYPGFMSINGPDLAARMREQAEFFGAEIRLEGVDEFYSENGKNRIVTWRGEYEAGAVILATGGSPTKLNVPGEEEFAGRGVSYCAVCDGAFFKDEIITVVGGGDAAVEEALFLTKFGKTVNIIHRRDELRAEKIIQERAFANEKINIIWDSVVEEIQGGDAGVEQLLLRNVKTGEMSTLKTAAAFIFIGFKPNTGFIKSPVEKDEGGYILTDPHMKTSLDGVFAAGDVRSQLIRQITNATGDATTASIAAQRHLESIGWSQVGS